MNFLNHRHFPCLIHTPLLNLTRPTFQKNQFRVPLIKLPLPLLAPPPSTISPGKTFRRRIPLRRVRRLVVTIEFDESLSSPSSSVRKQGKQRYVSRDLGIGFPYRCLPPPSKSLASPRIIRKGSPPFPLFLSLFNVLGRENRFENGGTNKTRQRAEMDFRTHFSGREEGGRGGGGGGELVLAEGLRAVILDRC